MTEVTKKFYSFQDMAAVFATVGGVTQFLLVPKGCEARLNDEKLACVSPLGCMIDKEPMIHVALSGDGYPRDFTAGTTLRNSDTAYAFSLKEQTLSRDGDETTLVSRFENGRGLTAKHYLLHREGDGAVTVFQELINEGEDVLLEACPSFNLSAISPFERFHDPRKLILHKLISNWSGEGKLYSVPTDKLAFEPSWSGLGIRTEKWAQTGTMPARGQLPFVAVEDAKNGVTWAVAMEAPASWVMETVFRNGNLSVGGGMGDNLTGHWRKNLKKGETFRTNKAFITVVSGGLNEACARLVRHYDFTDLVKPSEGDLPVIYNEFCYSWGKPDREKLLKQLPLAAALGCKYFVVDDGWFIKDYGGENGVLGDWEVNTNTFPGGLGAFSKEVGSFGMKLGVWYEFESVSVKSDIYKKHPELMLSYAGKNVCHNGRAFFDFRKRETVDYLREKVIGNLKKNNVGYMKVDYNDNVGLGADGAESVGEGLRLHIEGVLSFFGAIKRELPDLTLEICSSGGMRHEPRFIGLADMVSFSDAHENPGGVNVACNLHRYIPPRKMQIWATIREDYSLEDVRFTAAKAMLGRYCLSGNLAKSPEIFEELRRSVAFYRRLVPVIRAGTTTEIEDSEITSYFKPEGRTYLVRESLDKKEKIVYAFAVDAPSASFEIAVGAYRTAEAYNAPSDLRINEGKLSFTAKDCPMWGCVIRLVAAEGV